MHGHIEILLLSKFFNNHFLIIKLMVNGGEKNISSSWVHLQFSGYSVTFTAKKKRK